jgi:hypothetical protein
MLNEKSYTIKKVKFEEGKSLTTEYSLLEFDGDESTNAEISFKSPRKVHEDLVRAFAELVPHLILLTESIDGISLNDLPKDVRFAKFEARSFSIGGSDEHRGVVISGIRRVNGNRVVSLSTPFTVFEPNTEIGVYEYLDELLAAVETCIDETKLFIEGKHAVSPQLELFVSSNS